MVPYAIVGDRLFQSFVFGIGLTYFMSIESKWTWISSPKNEDLKDKRQRYSLIQGICRLSYALYLINYFVVKTEFFTSRTVFTMSWYVQVNRVLFSGNVMMIASLIFHLVFVAPFDNLRRSWISTIMKKRLSNEKDSDIKIERMDGNRNCISAVTCASPLKTE